MKIFVDSANVKEIAECLERGFVSGITTNPSILSREDKIDFFKHIEKIVELLASYRARIPLSIEVFASDPVNMREQAEDFNSKFGCNVNLVVKVPIGWDELWVIKTLRKNGIQVNCTAIMSFNQAIMAANAGANYVSIFYGRIKDTGADARTVVESVHNVFKEWNSPTEIIVGSIRHICDINDAMIAGADIVTVPPKFFKQMVSHPKTDEAVSQFLTDFKRWNDK